MPLRIALLLSVAFAATSLQGAPQATTEKARIPVLVELFTSEGCSSCPPADALLAQLVEQQPIKGAQIIVLGEHVDYWDRLGWRDRFSAPEYTARQNRYGTHFRLDSVYTPQMVVDGTAQFVGNDPAHAHRAVIAAARSTKLPLRLSAVEIKGRTFSASVSSTTNGINGDLYAALLDRVDTTEVSSGENNGRTLRHVSVARTLGKIGTIHDLGRGPLAFSLIAPGGASLNAMQIVVFAQHNDGAAGLGAVVGVVLSASSMPSTALSDVVFRLPDSPHLQ